ncbi:MAG: FecR family protein [Treponema sp.]|jgi:hypothetical protein|nr:FecR family protein [Treponema sp.]
MKKTMLVLALLLAAAALFAQEAVIREIWGIVEVKEPGAAAWSPAIRGQALGQNVMISTGFRSGAVIAVGNSTLSVQPLTRLGLEELVRAGGIERAAINLRAGRIRAEVKPPAGMKTDFKIRSPTATASVRGTILEFDGAVLKVDEGRVRLTGGDGAGTYVAAGHEAKTDIETGRTVGAAEQAREDLTPPAPAGADRAPETLAVPSAADMAVGFTWK